MIRTPAIAVNDEGQTNGRLVLINLLSCGWVDFFVLARGNERLDTEIVCPRGFCETDIDGKTDVHTRLHSCF